jgi:hypothetical protein
MGLPRLEKGKVLKREEGIGAGKGLHNYETQKSACRI